MAQRRVTPSAASGLHQQTKEPLRCAKVARKKRAIGVDGSHQGDAPEVMPFGNHLRSHQNIDITGMYRGKLGLQAAFEARGVGINPRHPHRLAFRPLRALGAGAANVGKQRGQVFFYLFGALADRRNIKVAARRAGSGHAFGETAVVAAQAAVNFVKHAKRAAVGALTFPAAVSAMQNRGVASAV